MMKKNKIPLILLAISTMAVESTTSVVPYRASVTYDKKPTASIANTAKIIGLYMGNGNDEYKLEIDVAKTDIKYKYDSIQNLKQSDLSIIYNRYINKYFVKIGLHHIETTDNDLGNADTLIVALGRYHNTQEGTYTYTIEGFYSYYKRGHNEFGTKEAIKILQISPSFNFYKRISSTLSTKFGFQINYQKANQYYTHRYFSYKMENTFYYKKFFATLQYYAGEMKSGVEGGGTVVYNSKDLLKNRYNIKVGYTLNDNISMNVGYEKDLLREYGKLEDSISKMSTVSVNYTF